MNAQTDHFFDEQLKTALHIMANEGIFNAAKGMSDMIGVEIEVSQPLVKLVPLMELPTLVGGPENEAVGIYLRSEGALSGQMLMVIPYPKALELVDLLMEVPTGTTKHLGALERSALAELGNLTGSFFLNAVDAKMGLGSRPSPPAVIVDMIGAILDILITMAEGLSESVLMIQATFSRGGRETQAEFWMVPDRNTLQSLSRRETTPHA